MNAATTQHFGKREAQPTTSTKSLALSLFSKSFKLQFLHLLRYPRIIRLVLLFIHTTLNVLFFFQRLNLPNSCIYDSAYLFILILNVCTFFCSVFVCKGIFFVCSFTGRWQLLCSVTWEMWFIRHLTVWVSEPSIHGRSNHSLAERKCHPVLLFFVHIIQMFIWIYIS